MMVGAMSALAFRLSLPLVYAKLATSFTSKNHLSVLEGDLPPPPLPSVLKHLCSKAPGNPSAEAAVVCCVVRFMRVQLSGLLWGDSCGLLEISSLSKDF